MTEGITLDELLLSRDNRSLLQTELLKQHSGNNLVCMTVIIPGNIKRNSSSLIIAKEGVKSLREKFNGSIIYLQERDLQTGYEAYLVTEKSKEEAKRITCSIEDSHPLGRLMDLDVIDESENPISRKEIGLDERKCLLCNNSARYCMRNHTHTTDELLQKISQLVNNYVHRI